MTVSEMRDTLIAHYRRVVKPGCDYIVASGVWVCVLLALCWGTTLPQYLDNYLFYQPVMNVRQKWHLQPKLHSSLRLIVVDDRALEKLGRPPSFAEWAQIGRLLKREGYDTGLLQGFIDQDRDIGDISAVPLDGLLPLYAGAVRNVDEKNIRAIDVKDVPERLTLPCSEAATQAKEFQFPSLQTMSAKAFPYLTGLGDVALVSNHLLPPGMYLPGQRFVPPLGAQIAKSFPCVNAPYLSVQGLIYSDFVTTADALRAALPVTAFYDKTYQHIIDEPSPKLREHLAGGSKVIFIPEAFTGSRFIDSPAGKIPSYLTTVSLANSALQGRYLRQPFSTVFLVFIGLLIWLAASIWLRFRWFVIAGFSSLFLLYGGAASLVLFADIVCPPASLLLGMTLLSVIRGSHHFLSTVTEKTKLEKDLELGRTVQNLFLPSVLEGRSGDWEYSFLYQPFGAMSGDWLQHFHPGAELEAPTMVAIGDVVGKGASAALITAVIASLWSDLKQRTVSRDAVDAHLQSFLTTMHRAILDTFKGQQNSTISVVALAGSQAVLSACGAPHWVQWHNAGDVTSLSMPPQNPLGRLTSKAVSRYSTRTVDVQVGDVLIAYSDGVLDGSQARAKFVNTLRERPMPTSHAALVHEIQTLAKEAGAGHTLPDDFTLVILRFLPCAESTISATINPPELPKAE